jgi:hypothetical protein
MCPVVVHGSVINLTVNTHDKLLSNKFITHIQPSTGFGSMGPSSGSRRRIKGIVYVKLIRKVIITSLIN